MIGKEPNNENSSEHSLGASSLMVILQRILRASESQFKRVVKATIRDELRKLA